MFKAKSNIWWQAATIITLATVYTKSTLLLYNKTDSELVSSTDNLPESIFITDQRPSKKTNIQIDSLSTVNFPLDFTYRMILI